MVISASEVAAILILALPGFLAYRFAVYRRVDPVEKSPLWQFAEVLEYSVFVHVSGFILAFLLSFVLLAVGFEVHLVELFSKGPTEFLKTYPAVGAILLITYPVYVIVASTLMGAYDFPGAVGKGILKSTLCIGNRIRSVPFLRWVPLPSPEIPREPVWYLALHEFKIHRGSDRVLLLVKMKQGDMYYGELVSYPIQPDDKKEKDFIIQRAKYYRDGDLDDMFDLEKVEGGGVVLLNTADVDSIQVYYPKPPQNHTE